MSHVCKEVKDQSSGRMQKSKVWEAGGEVLIRLCGIVHILLDTIFWKHFGTALKKMLRFT